jgi:hypothetical protein
MGASQYSVTGVTVSPFVTRSCGVEVKTKAEIAFDYIAGLRVGKMTPFERAKIRLEAFRLLDGWGYVDNPQAEKLIDRLPTPWNLTERMRRADELAEWAMLAEGE